MWKSTNEKYRVHFLRLPCTSCLKQKQFPTGLPDYSLFYELRQNLLSRCVTSKQPLHSNSTPVSQRKKKFTCRAICIWRRRPSYKQGKAFVSRTFSYRTATHLTRPMKAGQGQTGKVKEEGNRGAENDQSE
jgi:hypothetical protein